MIPILYSSTETAFTSNGIGRLRDCISCTVTEERNGKYECEFQYPVTGRRFKDIEEGCFIGVTHDDSGERQPFQIYRRSAPINGVVTFNAHHISYKLNHVILNPFSASTVAETMTKIPTNSINANPFTFWTDKTTEASFSLSEPASVRSILGGVEGSILDVFGGGEYEFDNYTVKLYQHRGRDTGLTIRYGKNLSDIEHELDHSETYNAIVPFWADPENGILVLLDERIVSAEGVTNPQPVIMDMSQEFEEEPSQAQLRQKTQTFLANNEPWVPKENIKVDFIQLWQTTQYKDIANLQRVRLCDTVNVYYPQLGVTATNIKVVKTVYNVLLNKYDEMELGEARITFADQIKADYEKQIAKTVTSMRGFMDAAIDSATSLITGGQGGHIVIGYNANGQPEEILIMDTNSRATATNIIRMNVNGIGFSTDGGTTYRTAWTIDGHFVADFIDSGTLNANIIRAGILADTQGYNYWNLATGEFRLSPNTQVGTSATLSELAQKANTITSVDVEYATGTSPTTAPTTGWSTATPTWEEGKYIWTRTKTIDGLGDIGYSQPTCIQGAKGEDGTSVTILGSYNTYAELVAAHPTGSAGDAYLVAGDLYVWDTTNNRWNDAGTIQGPQGPSGSDGVGISSTLVQYGTSLSASVQPASWSTTAPTSISEGMWLWVKTITEYTNNTSVTTYSKSYIGTDGQDGSSIYVQSATKVDGTTTIVIADTDGNTNTLTIDDGQDGPQGQRGQNGLNGYVHVAWANSADGSQDFSTSVSTGKTYLGTYTDNTAADSQNYQSYSWSLIKGANGTNGDDGIGISDVVEQYYLSTSNSTQTGGSWGINQPAWISGRYIWTRSQVTWTNGTITTTTPVLAQGINSANQAVSDLNTALNQQEIFNRLTNNGASQGIYLENGLLYINAQYMVAGRIADQSGNSYWDLDNGEMNFVGDVTMSKAYTYGGREKGNLRANVGSAKYYYVYNESTISDNTNTGFTVANEQDGIDVARFSVIPITFFNSNGSIAATRLLQTSYAKDQIECVKIVNSTDSSENASWESEYLGSTYYAVRVRPYAFSSTLRMLFYNAYMELDKSDNYFAYLGNNPLYPGIYLYAVTSGDPAKLRLPQGAQIEFGQNGKLNINANATVTATTSNLQINGTNVVKKSRQSYEQDTFANGAVIQTPSSANKNVVDTFTGRATKLDGGIVSLYVEFTLKRDVTVPASGNIADLAVCTLQGALIPARKTVAISDGDDGGQAWFAINTGGAISITACEGTGSQRTITAGTGFRFGATYIASNANI